MARGALPTFAKEIASTRSDQFRMWPNALVYDPAFAADIREDAIPTDLQSVRALGENMGPLILYQWEAYNSYLHARNNKPDRWVKTSSIPALHQHGLLDARRPLLGCLHRHRGDHREGGGRRDAAPRAPAIQRINATRLELTRGPHAPTRPGRARVTRR